jgi:hypothetical protein
MQSADWLLSCGRKEDNSAVLLWDHRIGYFYRKMCSDFR